MQILDGTRMARNTSYSYKLVQVTHVWNVQAHLSLMNHHYKRI